jgi:hypothetical protein
MAESAFIVNIPSCRAVACGLTFEGVIPHPPRLNEVLKFEDYGSIPSAEKASKK